MKIISLIVILFFFCFNIYADDEFNRNLEIIKKFEKDIKERNDQIQSDDKRIEALCSQHNMNVIITSSNCKTGTDVEDCITCKAPSGSFVPIPTILLP